MLGSALLRRHPGPLPHPLQTAAADTTQAVLLVLGGVLLLMLLLILLAWVVGRRQ